MAFSCQLAQTTLVLCKSAIHQGQQKALWQGELEGMSLRKGKTGGNCSLNRIEGRALNQREAIHGDPESLPLSLLLRVTFLPAPLPGETGSKLGQGRILKFVFGKYQRLTLVGATQSGRLGVEC